MFLKRIETRGLAHFSYLVASDGQAFVIDPRYEVGVYLDICAEENLRLTHIFETHRNEDILSGAGKLAQLTGAEVFISRYEDLGYQYGRPTGEEDRFAFGSELVLRPLHTPGHTLGHLSYALYENRQPYMVFTGDALFYGGIGRTDFYGQDRLDEMTRKLHHSIYHKLAPLGEEVLVMPAHGHGSACGAQIALRDQGTLGYELQHNPALHEDADQFVKANARMLYKNHAFVTMEKLNLLGGGVAGITFPQPLDAVPEDVVIADIRDRYAFSGAHIPGSLHLPAQTISAFAGWFVDTDAPIALMCDNVPQALTQDALRALTCQGFHNIRGLLCADTLIGLETQGEALDRLDTISARDYLEQAPKEAGVVTLDVREKEEQMDDDPVVGSLLIPYQELSRRLEEVPPGQPLYVLCGSGGRATAAAAFLKKSGAHAHPTVIAGGIEGLRSLA